MQFDWTTEINGVSLFINQQKYFSMCKFLQKHRFNGGVFSMYLSSWSFMNAEEFCKFLQAAFLVLLFIYFIVSFWLLFYFEPESILFKLLKACKPTIMRYSTPNAFRNVKSIASCI